MRINPLNWHELTKNGLPLFEVVRPFTWTIEELQPGTIFPGNHDKHRTRILYEQNMILVSDKKVPVVEDKKPEPKHKSNKSRSQYAVTG